jgi:hypothetical protein
LDTLKKELGVEPAVRLMSTDSFCAAIETLLPHLTTLKEELGKDAAVRLLSTDSFCAAIDKLLPHLTEIRKDFDAEEAVKLFFSDSFDYLDSNESSALMTFSSSSQTTLFPQ